MFLESRLTFKNLANLLKLKFHLEGYLKCSAASPLSEGEFFKRIFRELFERTFGEFFKRIFGEFFERTFGEFLKNFLKEFFRIFQKNF